MTAMFDFVPIKSFIPRCKLTLPNCGSEGVNIPHFKSFNFVGTR
ncbi:MAG: hypothetical protein K0R75_1159 [Paenibacillaceae bacterium]|jgi:hypothetical protein|nr:hypothetical protein [Paenibacillaceae bacterium]